MHEHSVNAFIPCAHGLSVVGVLDLLNYIAEGQTLDEAITNASFDEVWLSPNNNAEQNMNVFNDYVERLRNLNDTGDAGDYWREVGI